MSEGNIRVFLTGAGGRTGQLVFKILSEYSQFDVLGLVRRQEQLQPGLILGDIRDPESFEPAMAKCDRLVILTSAVPKMRPSASPSDPPEWYFEPGEDPEAIDWVGQRAQIDAAARLGYQHIVLVSSMGVTRPDHPLNNMGKILMWKSISERYLACSGVPYTIIHAGGLIDAPGGERELLVGTGDAFLDSSTRTVPRADLAETVAAALLCPEALNKEFDLVARPPGEGPPTREFDVLFDQV